MNAPRRIIEDAVYTPEEVALMFRLSTLTIVRKLRRGEIKAVKIGKSYRILGQDLLALWRTRFREVSDRIGRRLKAAGYTVEDVPRIIQEVRQEAAKAKS